MERDEYRKMFKQESVYWWYLGLHELVEFYVQSYPSDKPLNILDAGCGTGRMIEILNRYGVVTGFERSSIAISFCAHRGLRNIKSEDLNTWTPQPEMYDIIVSNDVLSDSGIETDLAVAEKYHTALKTGGYLLMNLPAFVWLRRPHDFAVSTQRRYQKKNIVPYLEKTGFCCRKSSYRLPLLFILILIRKYSIDTFRKKNKVTSDFIRLPSFLNQCLLSLVRIENRMIESGISFIFGSSLFLVCEKK